MTMPRTAKKTLPESGSKTAPPDSAPPEDVNPPHLSEDEFEAKLAKFPIAEQSNLRVRWAKYIRGETVLWEEKLLRDKGFIAGATADGLPPQCSAGELGEILTKMFGKGAVNGLNKIYYPSEIMEWVKKKSMPARIVRGKFNGFNTCEAVQWVKDNILGTGDGGTIAGGSPAQGEAAANELKVVNLRRAQRADEDERRKFDARWMLAEFFLQWCDRFGTKLINAARDFLEKDCKALDDRVVVKYVADPVQQQAMLAELRAGRIMVFEDVQSELVKSIGTFAEECREQSETKKAELKVKLI